VEFYDAAGHAADFSSGHLVRVTLTGRNVSAQFDLGYSRTCTVNGLYAMIMLTTRLYCPTGPDSLSLLGPAIRFHAPTCAALNRVFYRGGVHQGRSSYMADHIHESCTTACMWVGPNVSMFASRVLAPLYGYTKMSGEAALIFHIKVSSDQCEECPVVSQVSLEDLEELHAESDKPLIPAFDLGIENVSSNWKSAVTTKFLTRGVNPTFRTWCQGKVSPGQVFHSLCMISTFCTYGTGTTKRSAESVAAQAMYYATVDVPMEFDDLALQSPILGVTPLLVQQRLGKNPVDCDISIVGMPLLESDSFVTGSHLLMYGDGKILLISERGVKDFNLPGGKTNLGETPTHCLERELGEELGAVVPYGQYVKSCSGRNESYIFAAHPPFPLVEHCVVAKLDALPYRLAPSTVRHLLHSMGVQALVFERHLKLVGSCMGSTKQCPVDGPVYFSCLSANPHTPGGDGVSTQQYVYWRRTDVEGAVAVISSIPGVFPV